MSGSHEFFGSPTYALAYRLMRSLIGAGSSLSEPLSEGCMSLLEAREVARASLASSLGEAYIDSSVLFAAGKIGACMMPADHGVVKLLSDAIGALAATGIDSIYNRSAIDCLLVAFFWVGGNGGQMQGLIRQFFAATEGRTISGDLEELRIGFRSLAEGVSIEADLDALFAKWVSIAMPADSDG